MSVLNAALAFALSMLVFTTIVSVLVEVINRMLEWRTKGLREVLMAFYDEVVEEQDKKLQLSGSAASQSTEGNKQAFIKQMVNNRALPGNDKPREQLSTLSTDDFLERLAQTDFGKEVLEKFKEDKEELTRKVDNYAVRFERFGDEFRSVFKLRAQRVSVVLALVVAFYGNIHAGKLFENFLNDQSLSLGIVQQLDEITADSQAAAPTVPSPSETTPTQEVDTLKAQMAKVRETLDAKAKEGLPIGTAYYPYCYSDVVVDASCASFTKVENDWKKPFIVMSESWGTAVLWFLMVVLSGLLIGMGGPFWYETVMSLNKGRQGLGLLRNMRMLGGTQTPQTSQSTGQPEPTPPSPVEVFVRGGDAQMPPTAPPANDTKGS